MAWVKLDDGYTEHLKLFEAGRQLGGRHGYSRAVAVDLQAMCYANRAESDGFLPRKVVESFHDSRPLDVAYVLVQARRWYEVEGGYKIHDFHEYQPLAADLKRKRKADAERQKKWRKGHTAGPMSRCDSRVSHSSPGPFPVQVQKDHAELRSSAVENPVENSRVLKALIWREVEASLADPNDLHDTLSIVERVKTVASKAGILYDTNSFRDDVDIAIARVNQRRAG